MRLAECIGSNVEQGRETKMRERDDAAAGIEAEIDDDGARVCWRR